MKHFNAQTGGRYTYVDDIINLQDLALALNAIFTNCDNFVVSGCEISGTTVSSGYVYINGELRYFPGKSGVNSWPQYLYESNTIETVDYASGTEKVGRHNYGCAMAASVPSATDPITGSVPQYIRFTSAGALRLKDAFFGKYALLLDAASGTQNVKGTVNFKNAVNVEGALSALGNFIVQSGTSEGKMFWNGNDFIVQAQVGSGTLYKFVINKDNGFRFYAGSSLLFQVNGNGIVTDYGISSSAGVVGGNIKMAGNNIYNNGVSSDSELNINMLGYNGGNSYFRDVNIGNGKGDAVIAITGSTSAVAINGVTTVKSADEVGLIIKSTYAKTDSALLKSIAFRDKNNEAMASVGYITSGSKLFSITNALGNIEIIGTSQVNIGPVICEGGTPLASKYVTLTNFNNALNLKIDTSNIYTRTQSDERYGRLANGLAQFIVGNNTKAVLRGHIDAMGQTDVTNLCPTKANLLSDMATDETKKAQIRRNIGAASSSDSYEPIVYDSGWKAISGQQLYARQIGKIVCIEGVIAMQHSGDLFTLPSGIAAPYSNIVFDDSYRDWGCYMMGGERVMKVRYCDHAGNHGVTSHFSITYMTA